MGGKKMEKYYEHVNEILVTYNDKFKQQLMNELREYNIDIVESTNKIIRYSCKSFVDILNLIKSNEPIFLQYYQPVLSKFDINNQNEMNCSIKKYVISYLLTFHIVYKLFPMTIH